MADLDAPPLTGNSKAKSSPRQVQAAAGAALTSAQLFKRCTVEIEFHASGTITYTNKRGESIVLSIALPAGRRPIEAVSVEAHTADITCYLDE